jgi:hypothetical protein
MSCMNCSKLSCATANEPAYRNAAKGCKSLPHQEYGLSLSDVSQVRAFLECCQKMSQYIKDYGITAAPLHELTKKARAFPKPWIKGTDYDLSLESLRSSTLDSANFLHHKNCRMRLFIEVYASDAEWGACAYQMVHP